MRPEALDNYMQRKHGNGRKDFEAYVKNMNLFGTLERTRDGNYTSAIVTYMWMTWKAGRKAYKKDME